ncbi:eukaryotic translation initiation factor 3 subunit 8 N-terminus-domain-containing protein [Gautieria morchelliformis]|nr:eukaryotic translation initiation factor 3 subunit 8 N-terminus-domain-containing protein [Gautieria morchelliformis]
MGDPSYSVQEITEDYDEFVERSPADEKDGVVRIRGSIISFVDRLDDEFTKSLQNIDPHGTEYVDRLKDEKGLYESICQAQAFYETTNQLDPLARVIMRRLEHIYSKPDAVIQVLEQTATQYKLVPSTTLATQGSSSSLIHSLSVSSYKSDNSFLRTRAMLCHIYHHALANESRSTPPMLRHRFCIIAPLSNWASRAQQLAQSLADKLGTMVTQNEKGLNLKLGGGSAWADRTDGTKQEKRTGDQAGERRRTGERWGGTASRGGTRGGRGAIFAQGLGNRMGQASQRTRA